ncbi:hypothetical protein ATANTOWER_030415 [Ataeniobius toweri]|uniref:Uncharacterized protein n=1 Tax=Ataeniobius toweri TaxID=208326 RepID=A0ABU7A8N7_9TELE|nr:hypothetical protein [Ataeniobius toweri]
MSLFWQTDITLQLDPRVSYDHRSYAAYRIKLCYREFPVETMSLRSRVKQFPGPKDGQQEPHHHGYGNVQFGGRQNELLPTAKEVSCS